MRRLIAASVLVLGSSGVPPARAAVAATPPTTSESVAAAEDPAKAVAAVEQEFEQKMRDFSTAYGGAKTDEERGKLVQEKYPRPAQFSPRLLQIARDNPKTPAALEALTWVVERDGSDRGAAEQALNALTDDFAADPGVRKVASRLMWSTQPAAGRFLRAVIEKNPDRAAKGTATFVLGRWLANTADMARAAHAGGGRDVALAQYLGKDAAAKLAAEDPDALVKEAEAQFQKTADDYGDVEGGLAGTLGKSAAAELFELRNLGIGKKAPEITGEDVDGKPMKLSDFAGKVVVLDFFGDW